MRRPPRHVAIPVTSTELRWIPGGVVRRENRLTLSPRHSPSRRSLVPNLPGGSGTGGGSGGAGAHHAFLLTWTWQRRFNPARSVQGHGEEGGPEGGPAAPSPGSPGTPWGAPQPHPQEPASRSGSRRGRARRLGSVGAAPALTLSPERRQQRQEQEQPQRPGPAEVVHRPGALAPSGSWLSCGVQWTPPFRLLLLLLSQPPETGWKRACRNPHSVGFTKI